MRIVRLAEFLALPEGTIYAQGMPWVFTSLHIKGENTPAGNWWALDPCWVDADSSAEASDRLEAMLARDARFPMNQGETRASADDGDVFLVFERADLEALRENLDRALAVSAVPS